MEGNQIALGIVFLFAGLATGAANLFIAGADGIISLNSALSLAIILVSVVMLLNGIKPQNDEYY